MRNHAVRSSYSFNAPDTVPWNEHEPIHILSTEDSSGNNYLHGFNINGGRIGTLELSQDDLKGGQYFIWKGCVVLFPEMTNSRWYIIDIATWTEKATDDIKPNFGTTTASLGKAIPSIRGIASDNLYLHGILWTDDNAACRMNTRQIKVNIDAPNVYSLTCRDGVTYNPTSGQGADGVAYFTHSNGDTDHSQDTYWDNMASTRGTVGFFNRTRGSYMSLSSRMVTLSNNNGGATVTFLTTSTSQSSSTFAQISNVKTNVKEGVSSRSFGIPIDTSKALICHFGMLFYVTDTTANPTGDFDDKEFDIQNVSSGGTTWQMGNIWETGGTNDTAQFATSTNRFYCLMKSLPSDHQTNGWDWKVGYVSSIGAGDKTPTLLTGDYKAITSGYSNPPLMSIVQANTSGYVSIAAGKVTSWNSTSGTNWSGEVEFRHFNGSTQVGTTQTGTIPAEYIGGEFKSWQYSTADRGSNLMYSGTALS